MYRKRNNLKIIALVCVLVLLTIGVAFAIVKVTGVDKTKTIGSSLLYWQVGGLDADGDIDAEQNAFVTKQHLGLDGLKIEVVKKPGVEVYVALFNKKGEPLNVTIDGNEFSYLELLTSETEATEWVYADYIDGEAELEAAKPAYAIVMLKPVKDVDFTNANMHEYTKQVTISYNRA